MDEQPIPLQDAEPELSEKVHVDQWDRSDPAKVLLAELNPNIEDVADVLEANGISRVRAEYIQAGIEARMRGQRRKAQGLADKMRSDARRRQEVEATAHLSDDDPDKVRVPGMLVPGNPHGNRKQRKAMIAIGDKKRAHRERSIKRILAREKVKKS